MENQTGKFSATKFYTSLQTHNDSTQEVGFNLEDNRKMEDTCDFRMNKTQSYHKFFLEKYDYLMICLTIYDIIVTMEESSESRSCNRIFSHLILLY